jgi:hypothetical protein
MAAEAVEGLHIDGVAGAQLVFQHLVGGALERVICGVV